MDKIIEVLEIKNDSNLGSIAGCRAAEWDGMDEDGISSWFEDCKKLTFENGATLEFSGIIPFATTCFGGGKGQAVLRLSKVPEIRISTPSIAYLQ